MAKRGQFAGVVDESGKLSLYNQAGYTGFLKHLAGKRITLTIGEDKPNRSTQANRYYWGVVVRTLADEFGYSQDDMHAALAYKFLRVEAEAKFGEAMPLVRSTATLKTDEFERYMEDVRIWAATEMGVVIPLPNEAP